MSAWVVFGLATLPCPTGGFWLGHLAMSDNGSLQVRFHDDIDGSSLARAIYAYTHTNLGYQDILDTIGSNWV